MSEEPKKSETPKQSVREQQKPTPKTPKVTKNMWLMVGGVVILCALSFLAGAHFHEEKERQATTASNGSGFRTMGGLGNGGQNFGGRFRMRGVFGTVKSVSSTSITVHDARTDSDKTLTITTDTKVLSDGQTASVGDIKTGDDVMVRTSSSNSSQVTQIILNPQMPGQAGNAPSAPIESN